MWVESLCIVGPGYWTRLLKPKGDRELFTPQVGSIMELSFQKLIKTRNLNSYKEQ